MYKLQLVFNTLELAETAQAQVCANMGCQQWDTIRQRTEVDNKFFFELPSDNAQNSLKDIKNIYSIEEYSPMWLPEMP